METTVAILGGTGPEGRGLASRLAMHGAEVVIGSRSPARAAETVERLRRDVPGARFTGTTNVEAAGAARIVILTVPFGGVDGVLDACGPYLGGKLLIDTVVPIRVENGHFDLEPVPEGSAAEHVQARVPSAKVVAAFQNLSAEKLLDLPSPLEGDVVICGNDAQSRAEVAELVRHLPNLRPVDGGELAYARALERLTALLLGINRRHGVRASFRLTGL